VLKMAAIIVGREQTTREIARIAYQIGLDVGRTGLLKKLKKKRKYRKVEAGLRVLMGLALTDQAAIASLRSHRTTLEGKLD
jgi:hypothetical protein